MCLTIPGKLAEVDASDPAIPVGIIDYGGLRRRVNLLYLPEARAGDYVIVHAGFAVSRLDAREAEEALLAAAELNEVARAGTRPATPPPPREGRATEGRVPG